MGASDRPAAERHEDFLSLLERVQGCQLSAEVDELLAEAHQILAEGARELEVVCAVAERVAQALRDEADFGPCRAASAVLGSASDPVWVLDDGLCIIGCNPAFRRLMLMSFEIEVELGASVAQLPSGVREQHEELYRAVLASGPIQTDWTAPGSGLRFDIDLRPIELGTGRRGIAVVARDATEHRARAQELAKARDEAQQGGRAAKDFLAQISHEVRTPLNAIVGLTDVVLQGDLQANQRGVLDRIQVNSRALLHLVGNVLDLSKAEVGQLDLQPHPANLRAVFNDAVEFLRPRAEAGRLELRSTAEPGLPDEVLVDTDRLRQIITNLVDNAIRYTTSGTVNVRLKLVSAAEDEVIIELAVKDTGSGIPRRDHEMVFSRFFRSYRSQVDQGGGSGLGLAVTRAVVESMEGEIRLRSAPGKGSTFRVRLPMALPVLGAGNDRPSRLLRPLRVLVADDSVDNLAVVEAILRRGGHHLHTVSDGRQAVGAMFEQGPFDVVLMDVDMPVMDGVRATVEIRSREGLLGRPRVPILAITAHATESVRRRCTECGMDGFITKPIDGALLLDRLDTHGSAARVMTVSAKPAQQKVMERAVREAGAEIVQARSMAEAISLVQQVRPHVAVLDLELPDGSGLELVGRLRAAGLTGPVVGCGDEADIDEWSSVEVTDCLRTPVRVLTMQAALARALAPGRTHTWDPEREIDPDLQDLVPLFLAERRKDLGLISEALQHGDLEALQEVGHRIKGTGSSYGYPELTEAGAVLEEAARSGDLDACRDPIEAIRSALG